MRVTRSLLLIFALAFTAAGCAQRIQYVAMQPPGPAPQGIDNVVYGPTAAPAAYRPTVAPAMIRPTPVAMVQAPPAPMVAPGPMISQGPMAAPGYGGPFQQGGYTLDSGDRLRVVIFGQDGLTNSYVVDASGHIDMPLIGSVASRGLTTDQLSARIADQLRQGFIREPHVAVEIEAYRPFFILGEVAQPGQYPYVANMTVETAVAIAGGFGPRGYHKTVIISRNAGGRAFRFEAPITYPICPGDTVQIQERWF